MKYKVCAVVLALSLSLAAGGCAGRTSTGGTSAAQKTDEAATAGAAQDQHGYLAQATNEVMFIQLVDGGDHVDGQLQLAHVDQNTSVAAQNYPFTGSRSGSDISITLTGSVWTTGWNTKTLTGTLKGNQLTLVLPNNDGTLGTVVFKAASVSEYNAAVASIKQAASNQLQSQQSAQAAAKAAQDAADEKARQQRAVVSANASVANALSALSNAEEGLAYDTRFDGVFQIEQETLATMRGQYADIQQKAAKPLTCFERGHLDFEVGQIEFNLGHLEFQNGQADYIKSSVTDRMEGVRSDIETLQGAWDGLQAAVRANTTGTPSPAYTADEIQKAIQVANSKATASSTSLQQALDKSNGFYSQGKALLTTAQSFMKTVSCSY